MRAAGAAAARVRRDHVPDVLAKTPVIAMLDAAELRALDAWIDSRPEPKPSRSEAITLLLQERLGQAH